MLALYYHPLASYCWKVLIALYETGVRFTPVLVDLQDEVSRARFLKLSPMGKFPLLRDDQRDETVLESTIIIEYLAQHHPGAGRLVPEDCDEARQVRLVDRLYDLYVHERMQKIVGDRLRPAEKRDAFGVAEAKAQLASAYEMMDREIGGKPWAGGDEFTLADCAAFPALFYGSKVLPLGGETPNLIAYLGRLTERPSVARVLAEAEPYFKYFPPDPEDR